MGEENDRLFEINIFFLFQTAESKHPILILKDTARDEASAMLEFAYTGEVIIIDIKLISRPTIICLHHRLICMIGRRQPIGSNWNF